MDSGTACARFRRAAGRGGRERRATSGHCRLRCATGASGHRCLSLNLDLKNEEMAGSSASPKGENSCGGKSGAVDLCLLEETFEQGSILAGGKFLQGSIRFSGGGAWPAPRDARRPSGSDDDGVEGGAAQGAARRFRACPSADGLDHALPAEAVVAARQELEVGGPVHADEAQIVVALGPWLDGQHSILLIIAAGMGVCLISDLVLIAHL